MRGVGRLVRGARSRSFGGGIVEMLGFVAAFVGLGLGAAAAWEGRAPLSAYAAEVEDRAGPAGGAPSLWLVDGYNVVSVGLLAGSSREGWWRAAQRRALLERAAGFDDPEAQVWVVFDGSEPNVERRGRACAFFAPSADAWLLEQVRAAPEPGRLALVTADRRLAERARRRGAAVVAPAAFLARCSVPESG